MRIHELQASIYIYIYMYIYNEKPFNILEMYDLKKV